MGWLRKAKRQSGFFALYPLERSLYSPPVVETHTEHASNSPTDSSDLAKPVTDSGFHLTDLAGVALIVCATLAAYSFSLSGKPLWDDDAHLTAPALQSLHGLWRIWFELGATQQYYPLLHSAFWFEHRLWGDAVFGYHLTNILLHSFSACLVVFIVRRLGLAGAWMAGLIFALHPVAVESVAWMAEQKNTLSTVFYLSASLTYLRFDKSRRKIDYLQAIGFFVMALLSKSVTATLPAALLVVFWWQRGRLEWKRDVVPLLPWLGLGVTAGIITSWVERIYIGAQGAGYSLTILERCLLAGRATWFYLSKLIWPANLIFIYPRWTIDADVWWQYLFPAGLLITFVAFLVLARRQRGPLAALLFFAGTLFPALGFINVFPFIYSYVADHFQYLAMLGVIVPVASLISIGAAWLGEKVRFLDFATCAMLLLVLGIVTWNQTSMYSDVETLWRRTVTNNPRSFMAYNNLGKVKLDQGWIGEALLYFQVAVMLKPDYAEANNNLGNALRANGRVEEAIVYFRKSTAFRPSVAAFHGDLANTLAEAGHLREAVSQYELALAINPADVRLSNNLAWILSTSSDSAVRNGSRAVELAGKAVKLSGGNDPVTTSTLAAAYAETGRYAEAVATAEKAHALALRAQMTDQAAWIAGLLEIYRSGRPYHGG